MKCFHLYASAFSGAAMNPNYVLGEIADVTAPSRVHYVDEHQRVVIGQVDVDVVGE